MTIKQHGGVFGRNPSFNNVYATNAELTTLDVSGRSDLGKTVVAGSSGDPQFQAGTAAGGYFQINAFDNNPVYAMLSGSTMTAGVMGTQTNVPLYLATNNQSRWEVTTAGNLRAVTAGNGIDFSATGNATGTTSSELFDDYEQGTWSPFLNGATGATYSSDGSYIKAGKMVFIWGYVNVTVAPTSGTNVRITGLPFTNDTSTSAHIGTAFTLGYKTTQTSATHGILNQFANNMYFRDASGNTFQNYLNWVVGRISFSGAYVAA